MITIAYIFSVTLQKFTMDELVFLRTPPKISSIGGVWILNGMAPSLQSYDSKSTGKEIVIQDIR